MEAPKVIPVSEIQAIGLNTVISQLNDSQRQANALQGKLKAALVELGAPEDSAYHLESVPGGYALVLVEAVEPPSLAIAP